MIIWVQQCVILASFPCLFSWQSPWLLSASSTPLLNPHRRGIPPPLLAPYEFSIYMYMYGCEKESSMIYYSLSLSLSSRVEFRVQVTKLYLVHFLVLKESLPCYPTAMKKTLLNSLFTWLLCKIDSPDHSSLSACLRMLLLKDFTTPFFSDQWFCLCVSRWNSVS